MTGQETQGQGSGAAGEGTVTGAGGQRVEVGPQSVGVLVLLRAGAASGAQGVRV